MGSDTDIELIGLGQLASQGYIPRQASHGIIAPAFLRLIIEVREVIERPCEFASETERCLQIVITAVSDACIDFLLFRRRLTDDV